MPLRRHASSQASASRSQLRRPRSRRLNGDPSAGSSSLHSTPSQPQPRTNGHSSHSNGAGRATLGDLILSSRSSHAIKPAKRVIELPDSSDDEPHPRPPTQPQHAGDLDDLDDIVTPELPPADASAPPLSDALVIDLVGRSESPSSDIFVDAESVITSAQDQLGSNHIQQPSSPPEPPPDPLANQRPLFDPEELEMQPLYDNLKALLETEQASDADDDDEDYEQRRLRKLRQNDALLAQLGLAAASSSANPVGGASADSETAPDQDTDDHLVGTYDTPKRGRGRPSTKRGRSMSANPADLAQESHSSRKKKKYDRKVKFAEDGTTKSAPLPGEVFDLAFVEIPPLRNRARNEYIYIKDVPDIRPEDLISWSEDEEEEDADAGNDEQDEVDDEPQFLGFDSKGRVKTKRKRYQPDVLPDGTVMTSCHQCRRKTPGLKMRCSRGSCPLMYCERCITVRYYDMIFDPYDPSFTCPRCLGYCNCSVCLRRSGHGDLLEKGRKHVLAYSRKLAVQADQVRQDGMEEDADAVSTHMVADETDGATPNERRVCSRPMQKERRDPNVPVVGPVKRRGRSPKKRDVEQIWTPVKIDLDLSDKVAEGEVFSPLEEYVLGRLHVARRVLNLVAAEQAAAPSLTSPNDADSKPKLVIKIRIPSRTLSLNRTFVVADGVEKKRKTPNYHDMEKDLWVRSAADLSHSESEAGDLSDTDMKNDTEDEDDLADTDGAEDAEPAKGAYEAMFEEDHSQSVADSLLHRLEATSAANSRRSSPLTSLDGASSESSDASSQYDGVAKEQSYRADDSAEEPDTSTQGSFETREPSRSLGMPQDMQQLALAVLEDHDGASKAVHTNMLRLHVPLSFPSSSGSEGGQLSGLLDSQSAAGTPLMFAESTFPDLDGS